MRRHLSILRIVTPSFKEDEMKRYIYVVRTERGIYKTYNSKANYLTLGNHVRVEDEDCVIVSESFRR